MPDPTMPDWMAVSILASVAGVLALLLPLTLHRSYLVLLARRERSEEEVWRGMLPRVSVQLPIYNEDAVVERLIDAVAALDYPRHLLEIQVLDDSDDGCAERAAERVRLWRARGTRIRHLRRGSRDGFKAGALSRGLDDAEGEFVLILDADFVPPSDLVHELLGPFEDPGVGMVQARWDHLNENDSLLTRCQALLLDGHFFLEQGGRWASGRFMSFNGSAGMWRRAALEEAGGWSSDTLTEDLDVSYRAQMAGWRLVFRPHVGVPAELPGNGRDLERQQKRWAQGGVQTGRKVLPGLWRGAWPPAVKGEATIHLLGHVAHPLTLVLAVLLVPSALARQALGLEGLLPLDLLIFAGATASFLTFFLAAGRRRRRPWRTLIPTSIATLALGVGLSATVSRSVMRGMMGRARDPFERTPKRGFGPARYPSPRVAWDTTARLALSLWMLLGAAVAVAEGLWLTLPVVVLFGTGFVWLALDDLRSAHMDEGAPAVSARRPVGRAVPSEAPSLDVERLVRS